VADLIDVIKHDHPETRIIIGGHSSGGGLAVRFAGSRYGGRASAYLLLAPFLKYNAPTTRPGSGGWARPYTGRIIGLVMLNNIGITRFNYLPVIDFSMPQEARDGTETLVYSHRLNTGYAPRDYRKDLRAVTQPLLVLAGDADQSFFADQYEPVITQYTDATVKLLPGVTHLGLIVVPETASIIVDWLNGLEG
jgi:non-heme chloroperoxidase